TLSALPRYGRRSTLPTGVGPTQGGTHPGWDPTPWGWGLRGVGRNAGTNRGPTGHRLVTNAPVASASGERSVGAPRSRLPAALPCLRESRPSALSGLPGRAAAAAAAAVRPLRRPDGLAGRALPPMRQPPPGVPHRRLRPRRPR